MNSRQPQPTSSAPALAGQIGLIPALASNLLNMVGIGPFLTIPLVIGAMAGPQAILGWAVGSLIALCDGLVWAEFGAAMPFSGGPYVYLREAYGRRSWGRLMSFLFLAQIIVVAPLTAASGAVGFAEYSAYLRPSLTYWQGRTLAVAVCLLATFLLYRNIRDVGKISMALTAVMICTMGWIIIAGAPHFSPALAFDFPPHALQLSRGFFLGLGAATLIAMYDFSGYFNVCLIGAEVKQPARVIPRCIVLSVVILAFCYAAMNLSIIGVIPWRQAMASRAIVSDFAMRIAGPGAAKWMTVLILVAAFGSVYSVLLGYSRVPYAAARDGEFFSIFARVHATKHFPSFSVLSMGLASAAACLISLDALIKSLLVIQILTQFIAQCVGLVLLRNHRPDIPRPFAMRLYPLPVLIAFLGWIFILVSSGGRFILVGGIALVIAIGIFLLWSRAKGGWPFRGLRGAMGTTPKSLPPTL